MPTIAAAPPAPGPQPPAGPLPGGFRPAAAPPAPDAPVVEASVDPTLGRQAPGAPDAPVVPKAALGLSDALGRPTPSPDPEAPTGVTVSGLTATGATVTWTTATANRGKVDYGTDPSLGTSTPTEVANTTTHSRTLTGLTAGTDYQFRCGTATSSATGTFSTPAA